MHSYQRKATARTASVIAVAGLVAALTSAPATAESTAAGAGSPLSPVGKRAPVAERVDSDVVPMNFAINAFEIRDNDYKTDGHTERTFKKATRAVKKIVLAEDGTVLRSYPKIGVVIAYTEDADFDDRLRAEKYSDTIVSLGATRTSPTSLPDLATGVKKDSSDLFAKPAIDPEPREDEQWGNEALDSLEANESQPGSSDVTVGVLDSGIQSDHEDLAAAIDHDASVDCTNNGLENTDEAAWNPTTSTHGTHVAGTIAAQRNGIGVAGIAPGVKVASVKVVNDDGYIFPEYAICGFMWSPKHGIDVTNNSYYIDPWMFWCADDIEQGAVQEAVSRAVEWTHKQGIVNVAAAGNASYDLANKTTDSSSPNDSTAIPNRPINNKCLDMPAEIAGVVATSATTEGGPLASFSNYGDGVIDVAGPGQSILSTTWPDSYASFSGTSMASPHVAAVAALIVSEFPDLTPEQVRAHLDDTAVDVPCPGDGQCTGTPEYNGYFGNGLVNALNAIE